jgi:hypothetical protein
MKAGVERGAKAKSSVNEAQVTRTGRMRFPVALRVVGWRKQQRTVIFVLAR